MENQKSSSKQIMLNYGLILGVVGILINVAVFAMGQTYDPHWIIPVIGIAVMIAVIVAGIKKVKESNEGYLSLGQALKTGLGIALISALVGVVYSFIFTNFIEPDYYARMVEVQEIKFMEKYPNFTDEQIEAGKENIAKFTSPVFGTAMAIIGSLFLGFIFSLIGGLIMKESKEE